MLSASWCPLGEEVRKWYCTHVEDCAIGWRDDELITAIGDFLISQFRATKATKLSLKYYSECGVVCIPRKMSSTPSTSSLGDRKFEECSEKDAQLSVSVSPADYDEGALRSGHRKVDRRLLYWYCLVYLIMRIHVGNISNTAIMNKEEGTDIKTQLGNLTSTQWAWALSCFYYPYMFLEPFSTLALQRFTPRTWMSRIMLTWGVISMCQGATQNYAGIIACRVLLGAAEAGFYPGVIYHLSFFYSPDSLPMRIGFFYACGMFSGTISGLLAYAISFMNGVGGLAGWRWLFILEGIPAIVCGVVTLFLLPNCESFPSLG